MKDSYPLAELLSKPSELVWEQELRDLLYGKRDHLLIHAGSADAYVESLIVQSANPAVSEALMHSSLSSIARTWRPVVGEPYAYTRRMLELISAFAPKYGFSKIMSVFSKQKEFGETQQDDYDQHAIPLTVLAIEALSAYYPAAPPRATQDRAFGSYVKLLRGFLTHPVYAPISTIHLLEVNSIIFEAECRRMFATLPIITPAVVSWCFDTTNFQLRGECLVDLFSAIMIMSTGMDEFERAIQSAGHSLELLENKAFISTSSGERIDLTTATKQLGYHGLRLDRLFKSGIDYLRGKFDGRAIDSCT